MTIINTTGRITIGRINCETPCVHVEILDDASNVRICEARLDFASFGELITGHGHMKCTVQYNHDERIGMQKIWEKRTVLVPDFGYSRENPELRKFCDSISTDGWIADIDDMANHHCWCGQRDENGAQPTSVSFTKYVPHDSPEAIEYRERVN